MVRLTFDGGTGGSLETQTLHNVRYIVLVISILGEQS